MVPEIPRDISFQAAIEVAQQIIEATAHRENSQAAEALSADIAQAVSALLQQTAGARGFFVAYLTGDQAVSGSPHSAILSGLRQSPQQSVDMLTKNLAMSTAMALAHDRQSNGEMAQQSLHVQSRTMAIIEALPLPELAQALQQLQAAASADGDLEDNPYGPFLARWNYDAEQRQHISAAAAAALAKLGVG
ncbi:MAG: hypothetical protein AAF289_16665 [Cyanobacteria bacterium P01_A01_bin.135]